MFVIPHVETRAAAGIAAILEACVRQPGAVPIRMDSSAEVRATDDFDVAIRTGGGHWAPFEVTRLLKQHEKRIGARTFRAWLQEEVRNADC